MICLRAKYDFLISLINIGTGKSATMAQIVDHARSTEWITLYLPHIRQWLTDSPFLEPSPQRPGFFDQREFVMELLQQFRDTNKEVLSELPLNG